MDKYIGRLLDNRYEILEVIGTGGMAVVYKARCHRLNRLVAIKILKDDFMEDEEFRRRFHSESQAVAMLSHPNIISVYDVSTSITADYIVMELIDGITLKQYMEKKGVLNWKETLHFAIQIAKALEHAHSRGIVHRDIKPHNVMVLKNGSVKVTDFGIARVMSKGNTLTKEALGSVHYISPEQAKGGRVDNRSDIYSLGVVMYEMMSGRPPYDGESPVSVAIQHINGGAVMPSTLNPNIPGGLEQIIMRAMAHEPSGRYATATQMLTDLDEFRKDPAILFDYNTPPTDEVTHMPKPTAEADVPEAPAAAEEKEQTENADMPALTPLDRMPVQEEVQPVPVRLDTPAVPPQPERRPRQSRQPENRTRPPRQPENRPRTSQSAAARRIAQERYEAEEARRNKVTTIAIIACAVVMLLAVCVFIFVIMDQNDEVQETVPNLIGLNFDIVKDNRDYKFKIKLMDEVYHDAYEAGKIVDQSPAPGEAIRLNDTVYVTVSLGADPGTGETEPPAEVPMIDITGKTTDAAKQLLDTLKVNNGELNLSYEIQLEYSEEVATGNVIKTMPAVGEPLTKGMKILVYVSNGADPNLTDVMPDLKNQDLDTAKKRLENMELDLIIAEPVRESDDEVQKDQVIRTEPAAGEPLKRGDNVTIYISDGVKTIEIPDMKNSTKSMAVEVLKLRGYDVENKLKINEVYSDEVAVGIVIGQSVPAGTMMNISDELVLTVSKGVEPERTKSVVVEFEELLLNDWIFWMEDAQGNVVVEQRLITAGTKSTSVTLTNKGTQTYTYYLRLASDAESTPIPTEIVVDFSEGNIPA